MTPEEMTAVEHAMSKALDAVNAVNAANAANGPMANAAVLAAADLYARITNANAPIPAVSCPGVKLQVYT